MSFEEMRYTLLTRSIDSGLEIGLATRRVARIMRFLETGVPEEERILKMAKPKKEKPESKREAARETRQEKKTGKKEVR